MKSNQNAGKNKKSGKGAGLAAGNPAKPPTNFLLQVIEQLKAEKAEFLVNSLVEPVVYLPFDSFQKYWPAADQRVMVHLSAIYHDITDGEFLKPGERDQLRDLIIEECYIGARRLTELEQPQVEDEPEIQAVVCLMNQVDHFQGKTADLLARLNRKELQQQLLNPSRLPVMTNTFSRRLRSFTSVLLGLGIEVQLEHREAGSHCLLRRTETFKQDPDGWRPPSSGKPSVVSSGQGTDLPPDDDDDGVVGDDAMANITATPNLREGEQSSRRSASHEHNSSQMAQKAGKGGAA